MAEVPTGLEAWAQMTGPSLVLDAVRRRAGQGHRTEHGTLAVELTPGQRREVARVLGTAWDVSGRPVRLQDLAAALAEHDLTVRSLIETVDGTPLVDLRAARAGERAAATAERSEAAAALTGAGIDPAVVMAWLQDPGLPRAGGGELRALVARTLRIWPRLPGPAGRPVRLAGLAAEVLGDAHALDHRAELGRAVARLIAATHGLPRPARPGPDWRRAWAAAGVRCDEVSSRVLTLNLPLAGDAPAARWSAAAPGAPLWLSRRSLAGDWSVRAGEVVFVCENPTVVEAAADELGPRCPPLVCTDGIPSLAALDLIAGLAAAGGAIRVRADIDEAGFVVVDQVRGVAPDAQTWRFDARTYARHLGVDRPQPVEGAGDPRHARVALEELYGQHRTPLHEEALLAELLADLAELAGVAPVSPERRRS